MGAGLGGHPGSCEWGSIYFNPSPPRPGLPEGLELSCAMEPLSAVVLCHPATAPASGCPPSPQEGLRHSGRGCSHAGSGGRTVVCSASSSSRPWPGSPCPASSVTTQASPSCPRTTSSCPTDSLGTLSSAVGSRHWTWLPGRKRTRGRVRGAAGK